MKRRNPYSTRNNVLKRLGFKSYAEYLKSPLWKSIRKKKLKRYPVCHCCFARSRQVHHMDYTKNTLLGKNPTRLVALCRKCHKKSEFDGKQKIFDLKVINARLEDIRVKNRRHIVFPRKLTREPLSGKMSADEFSSFSPPSTERDTMTTATPTKKRAAKKPAKKAPAAKKKRVLKRKPRTAKKTSKATGVRYPWDKWLDGKKRSISSGKDFKVGVATMRQIVRNTAKNRGLSVSLKTDGDKINILGTKKR